MTERWDEVADKLCQEVGAIWDCHQAIATALQAAFDAGQQSMLSERVCAQGHAQYASWSHCYLCQNYDAGHAAGVAQERDVVAWLIEETTTLTTHYLSACGWTTDPNRACRFEHESDARMVLPHVERRGNRYRVAEHMWPALRARETPNV